MISFQKSAMYKTHREHFLEVLNELEAAAVIPTATLKTRNHDCTYAFRPDSDFWYLTGFEEPASVLVLLPKGSGEEDSPRTVLYLRELDPAKEIWTGRRLGVERAREVLGVDEARNISELWTDLPELLKGYRSILAATGQEEERDRKLIALLDRLRGMARGGIVAPAELIDPAPYLHELRLHKSADEVAEIKRAAEVTRRAHIAAMETAKPGLNECEISALINYEIERAGSTGNAYESIVAGGDNAVILHYIENNAELKDGELLLIDAGAEWNYYASDVTRTFPINGRFTDAQRAIYELVLAAEVKAIEHIRPGLNFSSIHDVAVKVLAEGLVKLGLLEGPVEKVIEEETYARFYTHKTGHWMGLDVHDRGAYSSEGKSRLLEPGMITTVEPGLYIASDDETVDECWRGIGVRIEDDVLVTETGHEILTPGIPKSVEEVEAACAGHLSSEKVPG